MLACHGIKATSKILCSTPFAKVATRDLFVVSLSYRVPLSEVKKYITPHREFLKKYYDDRIFIASGPKNPREGGVIIASCPSRLLLQKLLESDPFWQKGIAVYEITEFTPTMSRGDFHSIAEEDVSNRS